MPPPMMSRTRLVSASLAARAPRVGACGADRTLEHFTAGFLGGFAQDDADLVLHGAAVPRRAQPQQPS